MTFISGFRQNKFKNKTTVFGNRQYHSKLEASVAADLELAKKASRKEERVVEVTPQYPIDIYLDSNILTLKKTQNKLFRYYIDFKVAYADGREEYVEAKGYPTDIWRFKWKITEQVFNKELPDAILRIVR